MAFVASHPRVELLAKLVAPFFTISRLRRDFVCRVGNFDGTWSTLGLCNVYWRRSLVYLSKLVMQITRIRFTWQ